MIKINSKNIKTFSLCEIYNKPGSNIFDSRMTMSQKETTKKGILK